MRVLLVLSTFFICYLPILFYSAFMPYLTRKTESFGVSIPEEIYDDPEVQRIRSTYRSSVLAFGVVFAIFSLFTGLAAPLTVTYIFLPIGTLIQLVIMAVFYLHGHRQMKSLKEKSNWLSNKQQVTMVDTDFRKRKLFVSPLWFMLYVVGVAITLGIGFTFYENMPFRVPMQFDFSGEVTRYAEKSTGTILFAPLMQVFITFIMAFSYWSIGKAKQQIDVSHPEESIETNRIFRYRWSAFTVFSGLALVIMFGIMQLTIVGIIKNTLSMIVVPLGFSGIIVIAAIVLSITTGQGGSRIRLPFSKYNGYVNRDEDRHWKWGVFYFNPDDPSIFVEKRFGIGWTNNFANPMSWVFMIGLIVLIVFVGVVSKFLDV
ncbi:MAG: DUF5808 domain-containing protein [Clostridia bacterium]|nr:DUF5808 domain-containing protein [Clostridia bacterium]